MPTPTLLDLSTRYIDQGRADGPVNRVNHQLSELADGIAMVEAFSHAIAFRADDGLVVFDTSGPVGGEAVARALRDWSGTPVSTVVYTHGHVDHVGGSGAFIAEAARRGDPRPRFVGHANVPRRMDRYDRTNGYNLIINARQFGAGGGGLGGDAAGDAPLPAGAPTPPPAGRRFLPADAVRPDVTYRDRLVLSPGGLTVELNHAIGETDDHTWAWIPEHKAICAGDFFIWRFPNAGNPQKVQRYPLEWAAAMRAMAAQGAELFLPAHGLPIGGAARIRAVLDEVAGALEGLVRDTLELMNAGARLTDILPAVRVDPALLERPYLEPLYDEPEFIVRNIWRLYGGWYDGNPANLKPAPDAALAAELAALAGGAGALARRAAELAEAGELRLACHLAEMATLAAPDDPQAHAVRAFVYATRRKAESSLMAKGIYGHAARESAARSEPPRP